MLVTINHGQIGIGDGDVEMEMDDNKLLKLKLKSTTKNEKRDWATDDKDEEISVVEQMVCHNSNNSRPTTGGVEAEGEVT